MESDTGRVLPVECCRMHKSIIVFLFFLVSLTAVSQQQIVFRGVVKDERSQQAPEQVSVKLSGSPYLTTTTQKGEFLLALPRKAILHLLFSHPGYEPLTKAIKTNGQDTVTISVFLNYRELEAVTVVAVHKPETLVGKPDYSIYDFDFFEDKLLLLTAKHSLKEASLRLADYEGKVSSSVAIPRASGEALNFFHDYEGYTELVCNDSVFRVDAYNGSLIMQPVLRADFNKYLTPVSDTMGGNYYYSNKWDKYPSFSYYYLRAKDTLAHVLSTVSNEDLLRLYNLEYYYLPSGQQLEARRMADYYKTDKHIVAALMSGFTSSMYYEPLYAPLFIVKDTICIFNHHNDFLYHYSRQNRLIDSVKISYHHPKNWREWKKQLFVDEAQNKVYAFFSKDGHHYLKQIDHSTGKEVLTYKLKHHSAEKIRIRNGYAYYVYRPFDSTQERFLYREKIE